MKAFIQDLDKQYQLDKRNWEESFKDCKECIRNYSANLATEMEKHESDKKKREALEARVRSLLRQSDVVSGLLDNLMSFAGT